MKKALFLFICAALMLSGCAAHESGYQDDGKNSLKVISNNDANTNIINPNAELDEIDTLPIISFSADLFKSAVRSSAATENISVSPLSAYFALSMAANGADAETLTAFESLFGESLYDINSSCSALFNNFTDTQGSTTLNINNSIWFTDKLGGIYQSYIERITNGFAAEAFRTDFFKREAKDDINSWISQKTNKLIPVLFEENLSPDTLAVLVNTIYIKTKWKAPFNSDMTYTDKFTNSDGTTSDIKFMFQPDCRRGYITDESCEGVVLNYDDDKTAFIAVKPTEGITLSEYAESLTSERLKDYISSSSSSMMNLSLPKFSAEHTLELNDILKDLGLEIAFDEENADFSNMGDISDGNIYISEVLQKVKVDIDEEGSEAAAATGIVMSKATAFMPPDTVINLKFDSPFIYAIVDIQTGIPLFIGTISKL